MNKFFLKTFSLSNVNGALLILRVGVSLMMLTHGYPKLMQFFSDEPISFTSILGLGAAVSLALAVLAEFFCSVFIILGLGTRLASIPLIVTMAVAAFHVHADDPFSRKEKALLFLLIYVVLLFTGGGKFSIDHIWAGKRSPGRR
jgi:putative oxidoreductase